MKTNKKLLIIAIFIASILSFSFFTLARYTNKVSLTGTIKTEKIKIEFNPLSNSEYEKNVSSTVTVNNLSGANLTELKYVWSKTEVDASTGTTFASGDAINVPEIEGEYYLCVYAEDENNFYNNKCSNKFYVDNKAPVIEYSTEEISGTNYLVVEVTEEGSGLKTLTNENNLTVASGYPVAAYGNWGYSGTYGVYLYDAFLTKADNYTKLAELAGINATSIADILASSDTLLSNLNAVLYMIYNCTGDFMVSAIDNTTFMTALDASPYKDLIYENEHWNKFLTMVSN